MSSASTRIKESPQPPTYHLLLWQLKMGSEEIGNCSHSDKHVDYISGSEQPLKKARYVWQLKGKYHLKDNLDNPKDSEHYTHITSTVSDDGKEYAHIPESIFPNENMSCQGNCYVENLLEKSEKLMSYDDSSEDESTKNIVKSICDEIPVTLVTRHPKRDDYLQKWQARQVVKGYIDNTINQVLETCMISRHDASNVIERIENDDQVEDEGILMAIQLHGLHSNDENVYRLNGNRPNAQTNSSFVKNLEIEEFTLDNYQNVHNEIIKNKMTDKGHNSFVNGDTFINNELRDHSHFLETAVSVAIRKKGLSSQNCT